MGKRRLGQPPAAARGCWSFRLFRQGGRGAKPSAEHAASIQTANDEVEEDTVKYQRAFAKHLKLDGPTTSRPSEVQRRERGAHEARWVAGTYVLVSLVPSPEVCQVLPEIR